MKNLKLIGILAAALALLAGAALFVACDGDGGEAGSVTGVSIAGSPNVTRGGSVDFTATVVGDNLTEADQAVEWSLVGSHSAGTGINGAAKGGTLTVDAGETNENIVVKATSVTNPAKSASKLVKVVSDADVWKVTFNPNGGKFGDNTTVTKTINVIRGEKIADADIPADPSRNGYTFDGWFAGGTQWTAAAAITANLSLTARWSGSGSGGDEYTGPWVGMGADPGGAAIPVSFNTNTTYQTIEGFGFFGAQTVYWSSAAKYSDTWAKMVLGDLGMTMWRTELDPWYPVTLTSAEYNAANAGEEKYPGNRGGQNADRAKQKPVVEGLAKTAKELGVDLRIILTVWSPPALFKSNNSTIEGGRLLANKRTEFANWLVSGLDMYKNEFGVDIYALSFQNESDFYEPYNSCQYTEQEYVDALAVIEPIVHTKYPNVLLFGAEHAVGMEAPGERGPMYSTAVLNAGAKLDVFAVHGYADGVLAQAVSGAARLWSGYRTSITRDGEHKPIWMTETSGYVDQWLTGSWGSFGPNTPGAFILGQMIGLALKEGQISAWVYWAWADDSKGQPHALSYKTDTNKKYFVSKHFYRYIRPGAKMVDSTCSDNELLVIPFSHEEENRFTCVVLNSSKTPKKLKLMGDALGTDFMMYQTTSGNQIDCIATRLNAANPSEIVVPGESIVTLVNSNY
jgi:uncharacterized repeat protein (TIGR02543 family)